MQASINTHLGKVSQYNRGYDPCLLVKELRSRNRDAYGISSAMFAGKDVWHIYEVGFLTNKGLPVTGVGKLIYPSHSECIVESKSLKLYFFSHNMMHYGDTTEEAVEIFQDIVKKDLRQLLQTKIEFKLFTSNQKTRFPFEGFTSLDWLVDLNNIEFTAYKEAPELLRCLNEVQGVIIENITTNLLRSNCKITGQPDWGDLFISYSTDGVAVDHTSLAQYIVSFRNENHFHEEVVEVIYKRIIDLISPFNGRLMVCALYTRRGGIDICPIRTSDSFLLSGQPLVNLNTLTEKTMRQ